MYSYLFGSRENKLVNPDHLIRSCESVIAVAETTATASSAELTDNYKYTTPIRSLSELDHLVRVTGVPAVLFPEAECLPQVRPNRAAHDHSRPHILGADGRVTPDGRLSSFHPAGASTFSSPAKPKPRRVEDLLEARWFAQGPPSSQYNLRSNTTSAASSPLQHSKHPSRSASYSSFQEAHADLRAQFLRINRSTQLTATELNARLLRLAEEAVAIAQAALEGARFPEAQQLLNLAMKACPSSFPTVIGRITILLAQAERGAAALQGEGTTISMASGSGQGPQGPWPGGAAPAAGRSTTRQLAL